MVNSPTAAPDTTLRNRDIVCFSNDWHGDPYSKTHLMRRLARDNRVLWINSIGSRAPNLSRRDTKRLVTKLRAAAAPLQNPEPNLHVLNPFAVPLYGSRWFRKLNGILLRRQIKRAMAKLNFKAPISWVFVPSAAVVVGQLGEQMIVYHCVDEFTAFAGVPREATAEMERQLLRAADIVIVSAEPLLAAKSEHDSPTVLVRHGVDHDLFAHALDAETQVPESIRSLPRPVLGFFGLVSDDWIDEDLLCHVAEHFASGSIVLLGSVTSGMEKLKQLPNVHMPGRVPYADLPAYCKGFDVALVPFVQSPLTWNCNPLKVWQYLAAGLPVVSTPIPEVEVLAECRIAEDHESFVHEIRACLRDPGPRSHRSDTMKHQTWDARIDEIRCHIQMLNRDDKVPAS